MNTTEVTTHYEVFMRAARALRKVLRPCIEQLDAQPSVALSTDGSIPPGDNARLQLHALSATLDAVLKFEDTAPFKSLVDDAALTAETNRKNWAELRESARSLA